MLDTLHLLEKIPHTKKVSILGVPLDLGKDAIGTDGGPQKLREQGLLETFSCLGIDARDLGDIVCPSRSNVEMGEKQVKYLAPIVAVAEKTATLVEKELRNKQTVFVFGGDHSIALGTIAGASAAHDGNIGVIWIDAHGDMMTDQNTLSGNVHGMPSSAAFGVGHKELVNLYREGTKVQPENMLYIGLKDLDQGEIDLIREKKLTTFTIFDVLNNRWSEVFTAIEALSKRVDALWVSIDIDSIDQRFAPATPMVNNGGLTYREITLLARFIGSRPNCVGADIVEFAPGLDENNKTAKLIVELTAALTGSSYGWYEDYMREEMRKQAGG